MPKKRKLDEINPKIHELVQKYRLSELKNMCRIRGLRVSGTKNELASRIVEHDGNEGTSGNKRQRNLPNVSEQRETPRRERHRERNETPTIEPLDLGDLMPFWINAELEVSGYYFVIFRNAIKDLLVELAQPNELQKFDAYMRKRVERDNFYPNEETLLEALGQIPNLPLNEKCPTIPENIKKVARDVYERAINRMKERENCEKWEDVFDWYYDDDEEEIDDVIEDDEGDDDLFSEEKRAWMKFGTDIYTLRIGNYMPGKHYCGQHRLKFDSNNKRLNIYSCLYTPPQNKPLKRNDSAIGRLLTHFERFKLARTLRMSWDVNDISGVHFHIFSKDNPKKGLLILEVEKKPIFETQRIKSNAQLRNEFRERLDFTKNKQASQYNRIYIIADALSLEKIVSSMCIASEKFAKAYESKTSIKEAAVLQREPVWKYIGKEEEKKEIQKKTEKKRKEYKPTKEMLELLVEKKVITEDESKKSNPLSHLYSCFRDACCVLSVDQMEKKLDQIIKHECGEKFTVLEFIKSGCPSCGKDDWTYYSFCDDSILTDDHDSHCDRCHCCHDWHYWHCMNCDNCSYGQSIPVCEHCGSEGGKKGKQKLKPFFDGELIGFEGEETSSDEEDEIETKKSPKKKKKKQTKPIEEDSEEDEPDFPLAPELQEPPAPPIDMNSMLLSALLPIMMMRRAMPDDDDDDDDMGRPGCSIQ